MKNKNIISLFSSAVFYITCLLSPVQAANNPYNWVVPNAVKLTTANPSWPKLTPQLFGAVANGSFDDTTAFQAFLTACTPTNGAVVGCHIPAGSYKLTSAVTAVVNTTKMPNLTSDGPQLVKFDVSSIGSGVCSVVLSQGSGVVEDVVWQLGTFTGSGDTGAVAVCVQGPGYFRIEGLQCYSLSRCEKDYNSQIGSFVEGVVCDLCYSDSTVATALEYAVGSGNASFQGSGWVNSVIKTDGTNPAILIGSGAQPYNGILNNLRFVTSAAANTTLIKNNNSGTSVPNFLGNITIEQPNTSYSVVVGATNSFYFAGNISAFGQDTAETTLTYGTAIHCSEVSFTGAGGTACTFAPYSSKITTAGTGQTITISSILPLSNTITRGLPVSVSLRFTSNSYVYIYSGLIVPNAAGTNCIWTTQSAASPAALVAFDTNGYGAPTITCTSGNLVITNSNWVNAVLNYGVAPLTSAFFNFEQ